MLTRRQFLSYTAALGAASAFSWQTYQTPQPQTAGFRQPCRAAVGAFCCATGKIAQSADSTLRMQYADTRRQRGGFGGVVVFGEA